MAYRDIPKSNTPNYKEHNPNRVPVKSGLGEGKRDKSYQSDYTSRTNESSRYRTSSNESEIGPN
ncbi:hypothetical protein [Bdellovibrio sp. NC01]|uniref:hypothetical protein n=1 Tax=Bdellovibrio sp. NC01 TaxID=2220073 RepID=UPI001158E7F2|nr:hypothetical protein [Bdellovibrio sp. NC01]QDK37997.1 hypothetical protein DOE51_10555 [Bdellovibrio sp. NC01]